MVSGNLPADLNFAYWWVWTSSFEPVVGEQDRGSFTQTSISANIYISAFMQDTNPWQLV